MYKWFDFILHYVFLYNTDCTVLGHSKNIISKIDVTMSSNGIFVVSVNMQYPVLNVHIRLKIMLVYTVFAADVVAVLEINMFWRRKTRTLNMRYS